MRDLISHVYYTKDTKSREFYTKKPLNHSLYSICFAGESLASISKLLQQTLESIRAESISFRQKYHEEIDYIEAKLAKIQRCNFTTVKFEEKELRKLYEKVYSIQHDQCMVGSQCSLSLLSVFLERTLKKFPSILKPSKLRPNENIIIDHITLAKLMEHFTDFSQASFFRKIVIHTYDLYTTPVNVMFYLVFKYFVPKPLMMTPSEQQYFTAESKRVKLHIFKILKNWLEERKLDFVRTPNLITILNLFLEFIYPIEKDPELSKLIRDLSIFYQEITEEILESKKNEYMTPRNKSDIKNRLSLQHYKPGGSRFASLVSPKLLSNFQYTGFDLIHKTGICYQALFEESAEVIAGQLTLIDWKHFSRIDLSEMICKRWTKPDKSECPYYWKYVKRFNSFSYWIQYIILCQESFIRRVEMAKTFLKIATICIKKFNNYASPHYIFSALMTLRSHKVISFENSDEKLYNQLQEIFQSSDNAAKVYDDLFKKIELPAIPNLNIFLKIFLKLQDGVNFYTKFPESGLKYIKFPVIVQIDDYCNEMRKFQKKGYENITEDVRVYKFLKEDYKKGFPVDFENNEEILEKLMNMVEKVRERQNKLFSFFGM